MGSPKRLHVGCGNICIPGWHHVDAQRFAHVDTVCDIRNLSRFFSHESAEIIYACTVLEHFSRVETPKVLEDWAKVLAPGGTLRLSVPDFGTLSRIYQEGVVAPSGEYLVNPGDLGSILGPIIGGQRNEWDFHKNVFDSRSLTDLLERTGYGDVRPWDWRVVGKTEHGGVDDYSRAYLPLFEFSRGVNTSLNLEATRR